ncbi:MAG: hypothetical protein E6J70_02990 [Deltaproteobacteria bacterium]|nr:MAG: hypothetical protein E6J70_02990 [Deltaproteobacteria bacterium]
MKRLGRWLALGLVSHSLTPVLLTKLASTPMRLGGATLSLTGAFVSILPLVGNQVDETLEKADKLIDEAAETVDDIPI